MSQTRTITAILTLLAGAGCETIMYGVTGSGTSSSAELNSANPSSVAIPSCPDGDACLSAMTFNMRHRNVPIQLEALAKGLRADVPRLPDFILCQEVVFGRPQRKGEENTAALLATLLGYHERGTARKNGMEGLAILSRHPFDHYDQRHLGSRDGFFSGGFPRVSVMGEFLVPDLGRVRVVNVHLAHRRSRHELRREQLRETLAWMADREREVPADVILLGGDFNIEPEWEELALVHDSAANGDLVFADHNPRVPTSGRAGNPSRRVDYFFVAAPNRNVDSVGEAILWPHGLLTSDGTARFWLSDHLLLMHVFAIRP